MGDPERVHVLYSGQVQGVGFRFTVEKIAAQFNINGFARNLPDGNVEVVAEADREILENFINSINEDMRAYIGDSQIDWEPACGEFSSFNIRF